MKRVKRRRRKEKERLRISEGGIRERRRKKRRKRLRELLWMSILPILRWLEAKRKLESMKN